MPVARRLVMPVAPHSVMRVARCRERRVLRRPDLPGARLGGPQASWAAVAARRSQREVVGAAARRSRPVGTVVVQWAWFLARDEPMRELQGDLLRVLSAGLVRQQAQLPGVWPRVARARGVAGEVRAERESRAPRDGLRGARIPPDAHQRLMLPTLEPPRLYLDWAFDFLATTGLSSLTCLQNAPQNLSRAHSRLPCFRGRHYIRPLWPGQKSFRFGRPRSPVRSIPPTPGNAGQWQHRW